MTDSSPRASVPSALALVEQLSGEMRTIAMVAGQCSVEGPDDTKAHMAAAEAERASRWADKLDELAASLAVVPSPQPSLPVKNTGRWTATYNTKFGAAIWYDGHCMFRVESDAETARISEADPVPLWQKCVDAVVTTMNRAVVSSPHVHDTGLDGGCKACALAGRYAVVPSGVQRASNAVR